MNTKAISTSLSVFLLAGCSTPNLVFVDHNKIAIAIGASVPDQKADLTVGYESHSVALVPTVTGSATLNGEDHTSHKKDALSVFASFKSLGSGSSGETSFQLGRVFATGIAAQKMAENYSEAAKSDGKAKLVNAVNQESDGARRQELQKQLLLK